MKIPALLLAAALIALPSCGRKADAPTIAKAWVRLPAVSGQPGAAYFTLTGGGKDDRLVRVESALVSHIELHESMKMGGGQNGMGGMGAMKPTPEVAVSAGEAIAFAPGGRHAMLFGIDKVVTPGTAIPLRFGFASGKTAEAEAKTVGAGEDAPY